MGCRDRVAEHVAGNIGVDFFVSLTDEHSDNIAREVNHGGPAHPSRRADAQLNIGNAATIVLDYGIYSTAFDSQGWLHERNCRETKYGNWLPRLWECSLDRKGREV